MKLFILIFSLSISTLNAQWKFPSVTSIGDTSFYRIDHNLETALTGFKNVLQLNGYEFHKKEYTPKDRIMYVIYDIRPSDPDHVYIFYLIETQKGYEAWYEYRTNMDFVIINDELTITYKRMN
jgi:hypothetical protein